MSFDDAKMRMPVVRGELALVLISTTIALGQIERALTAIGNGDPIEKDDISKLRQTMKTLDKFYDDFTGWTSDR